MTLVGKTHGPGNLAHGEIRPRQQPLRPLDTGAQHVLVRGNAEGFTELAVKVKTTDTGHLGQIIEADRATDPGIDVLGHAAQLVARQSGAPGGRNLERAG